MSIDNGGPAFPFAPHPQPMLPNGTWDQSYDPGDSGMTLRQYAAIKLCVPDSGEEWLDEMIRASLWNEFAAKALGGLCAAMSSNSVRQMLVDNAGRDGIEAKERVVVAAHEYADAMLAARGKSHE